MCVGKRYNRYGTRLLLRIDEDRFCSVPRQWTDVVGLEPEVVIGGGRALFRVADLLELSGLVSRLVEQERRPLERNGNDAAHVKETAPLSGKRYGAEATLIGNSAQHCEAPKFDSGQNGGIIQDTKEPDVACPDEPTLQTPRRQRFSRRAR